MEERWDAFIRTHSHRICRELNAVGCDPEDVAQQVRLVFLQRREELLNAGRSRAYISAAAARYEGRRAAVDLCGDEIRHRIVRIDSDPKIAQLFYSSYAGECEG